MWQLVQLHIECILNIYDHVSVNLKLNVQYVSVNVRGHDIFAVKWIQLGERPQIVVCCNYTMR